MYQTAMAAEEDEGPPVADEPIDMSNVEAPPDNLKITAPARDSKIDTAFTITGTINPACSLMKDVFITSDVNHESYAIPVTPQQTTENFTIQVDTTLAGKIGKQREQLVPEVPPAGLVYVFIWSVAPACHNSEPDGNSFVATLQHPAPPVTKAQPRPLPTLPTQLEDLMIKPDKPFDETDEEFPGDSDEKGKDRKVPPEVWLVLAFVGSIGLVCLAEYSAYRYHQRHKKR